MTLTTRRRGTRSVAHTKFAPFVAAAAAVGVTFGACTSEQPATKPAERAAAPPPTPIASENAPAVPSGSATMDRHPKAAPADAEPSRVSDADGLSQEPRVYARSRFVWIWPRPDVSAQWIGFLWLGGSAKLASTEPIVGNGCAKFVAIEPRGYVCVDDRKATLDPKDAFLEAARAYAPNVDSPWPHRYGESIGLKRYAEIPSEELQQAREGDLTYHLSRIAKARAGEVPAELAGIDFFPATGAPPSFPSPPHGMFEHLPDLKPRSTVTWSTEGFANGRSWLLSGDLRWVPKDRVKVYPQVAFQGVRLGTDGALPLAFFRKRDRPRYARTEAGQFETTDRTYSRLSWVALTGKSETIEATADAPKAATYLQTREGDWIREDDAVLPVPRTHTPWGARVGAPDTTGAAPPGRATWMEVDVWGGWLIAYEGTHPVYVTLISPGRGGTPVRGKDPLATASTPVGRFNITGKFKTATMEAPGEFVHSDVPWTQNFSGPHALHGAYWHDDWGELKSAGCINVSPKDGKWLFEFTEPRVPPGWHGVRWLPHLEPATTLIVR